MILPQASIEPWRCVLANNTFPYIKSEAFIVESNVDAVVTEGHDWVPSNQDPNWSASVLAYFSDWHHNMSVALGIPVTWGCTVPACLLYALNIQT